MLRSLNNHHIPTTSTFGSTITTRPQFTVMLGRPQRRGFATSSSGDKTEETTFTDDSTISNTDNSSAEVDATLERLFQEQSNLQLTAEQVANTSLEFVPTWWYFSDQCIQMIFKVQELSGVELGTAIMGTTLAVRLVLFPIVLSTQKSASRMAHVQPELEVLKHNFEKIRNPTAEDKIQMGKKVQDLFRRYDVSPFRSMLMPFIQFPFFLGMFFGLKKMPDYFAAEMATG
ncbi:mitochondrial inner membrane protein (Partial), partial [Seminavis robusta]|eukprot:Sro2368_g325150.1 mitochondrial inner membrane protein (229) ;mRNA; f:14759-15445